MNWALKEVLSAKLAENTGGWRPTSITGSVIKLTLQRTPDSETQVNLPGKQYSVHGVHGCSGG